MGEPAPSQVDLRPARDHRFAAGLVLGIALAAALAIALTTLLARPAPTALEPYAGPVVVTSEDVAAASTPTSVAWPFRAEWLTPRAAAR